MSGSRRGARSPGPSALRGRAGARPGSAAGRVAAATIRSFPLFRLSEDKARARPALPEPVWAALPDPAPASVSASVTWGLSAPHCGRWVARRQRGTLRLLPVPSRLLGPTAAPVRGCRCHETLRQGQGQCQPSPLPPQQEVPAEVTVADVTVAGVTTAVPIPHLAAGFSRGPDITLSLLSAPVDTRTSRCGLAPSPAGGLVRLATGGGLQLAKVSLAPESGCVAFKSPKPHCFLADVNPGGVEPCASPGRAAALVSAAALPWSPGYCMRCSAAGLPSTFLLCGPQGRPGCPSPPPLHQPCGSPAPPWPWPSTGQTGTLSPPAAGGLFCVWVTGHLFSPRYCAALIMVLIT